MHELLQIPAELTKAESLQNRALKLTFASQQELPDELMAKVMAKLEKTGWLTFTHNLDSKIVPEDVLNLKAVEEDGGKSPAQRLRACFYRLWESKGKSGDFELYYRTQMTKLIDQVKERIV